MTSDHFENLIISNSNKSYIVGIDEVGRGCLAGPVVVACSVWKKRNLNRGPLPYRWLEDVTDSKKLSRKKRSAIFESCSQALLKDFVFQDLTQKKYPHDLLTGEKPLEWERFPADLGYVFEQSSSLGPTSTGLDLVDVTIGSASALEIDTFNIWEGVQLAARRALWELTCKGLHPSAFAATLVDGSLPFKLAATWTKVPQKVIVEGDSQCLSIALASVIAKEFRDRYMESLAVKHPEFGFEKHKGYATDLHRSRIKSHQIISQHRVSFLGKILPCPSVL